MHPMFKGRNFDNVPLRDICNIMKDSNVRKESNVRKDTYRIPLSQHPIFHSEEDKENSEDIEVL